MTLVDWACVVLIVHFTRLTLRAVGLARHQAYDSTAEDIARGLGFTKIEDREVPTKADASVKEVRKYEVPDLARVRWYIRLKVFGAQFLSN